MITRCWLWKTIGCTAAFSLLAMAAGCEQREKASDLDVDLRRRAPAEKVAASRSDAQDDSSDAATDLDVAPADTGQPPVGSEPPTNAESKESVTSEAGTDADTDHGSVVGDSDTSPQRDRQEKALPPVFPGGQPQKLTPTAQEAVRSAKRRLAVARSASRKGNGDEAVESAMQAFEIASEYAAENGECEEVAKEASRFIDSLGRRTPSAQPARTEFR
jgi:hypothetical protein